MTKLDYKVAENRKRLYRKGRQLKLALKGVFFWYHCKVFEI